MSDEQRDMTCREAGQKGGAAMKAKAPPGFYQEAGRKGGSKTKANQPPDYYRKLGRLGGQANVEQRGIDGLREAGRKGGERVRDLVKRGLELEAKEKGSPSG